MDSKESEKKQGVLSEEAALQKLASKLDIMLTLKFFLPL